MGAVARPFGVSVGPAPGWAGARPEPYLRPMSDPISGRASSSRT